MEMKDYLEQPTKLYQKIKKNEECAANWRRIATTLSSTPFDRERVSTSRNTNAPFASPIEKAIDLEQTIQRQYGALAELKTEVSATISLLDDPMKQMILLFRYIQMMSWEDVMLAVSLPRCTMFWMHGEALKELEVIANEHESC